jgi:hypothetical protein
MTIYSSLENNLNVGREIADEIIITFRLYIEKQTQEDREQEERNRCHENKSEHRRGPE